MLARNPHFLIVGSDGTIGSALLQALPQAIGTTRRPPGSRQIHLDLSGDLHTWKIPGSVEVLINCAAVTKLEACKRDPVGSRRVNVEAVMTLAEKCRQAGIFFIHLSSDKVFSGQVPNVAPDAPFAPVTAYGRQKAEAERYLLNLPSEAISLAIVRLTKVLTPAPPLFRNWRDALQRGEVIHPFADMTLAPVPLPLVVQTIKQIAEECHRGIFPLSAGLDVSYAEVAGYIAKRLAADSSLVQSVSAAQTGAFDEAVVPYTSLDCAATQEQLRTDIPPVWATIDWAIRPLL